MEVLRGSFVILMGPISPQGSHCPLCYMKCWLSVSNTGLIVLFTDVQRSCIFVWCVYVHIAINFIWLLTLTLFDFIVYLKTVIGAMIQLRQTALNDILVGRTISWAYRLWYTSVDTSAMARLKFHNLFSYCRAHFASASYQIRKSRVADAPGMPRTFSPQPTSRKPLVSDPGMHHGPCVTYVPWCISGSLLYITMKPYLQILVPKASHM